MLVQKKAKSSRAKQSDSKRAGAPVDERALGDEESGVGIANGVEDAQVQADLSLDDLEAELERPAASGRPLDRARTPILSGGDVDADWDYADGAGDETVGGSAPTPDQDRVDEIGQAVGLTYSDSEPLHSTEKVERRDLNRWELDPASAEDYEVRLRSEKEDTVARGPQRRKTDARERP